MPFGTISRKTIRKMEGKSRSKPKKTKYSKPIGLVVKQALSRQIETKVNRFQQAGTLYFPSVDFASFYSNTGDLACISPHASFCSIGQGVGDSQRIGNVVKTASCNMKLALWVDPYSAGYNAVPEPFYVKIWIFECPYNNTLTDVQSIMFNAFMNNNTSQAGLSGLLSDLTGTVNSDIVRLKKTFICKLGSQQVYGTGGTAATQYYANNDFKIAKTYNLNLTKYIRKTYVYSDTTNTPYNIATWLAIEPIPFNNALGANTARPGQYSYTIEYKYKDA